MKSKTVAIIAIIALAIVGLIFYWQKHRAPLPPSSKTSNTTRQATTTQPKAEGLGAQVYEKTQNPVKDKVPETNPFKQEYTNPFQ